MTDREESAMGNYRSVRDIFSYQAMIWVGSFYIPSSYVET